jgi:hypothetical protein
MTNELWVCIACSQFVRHHHNLQSLLLSFPPTSQISSSLSYPHSNLLLLPCHCSVLHPGVLAGGGLVFDGVDFQEVVEDDEEHGEGAEKDRESVQAAVRYHLWRFEGHAMVKSGL